VPLAVGTGLVAAATGCSRAPETISEASPPVSVASHTDTSHALEARPTYEPSVGRIVRAGSAPTTYAGADQVHCVATARQTGGSYSFLEIEIPAGSGPPPHQHDADEWFLMLSGTAAIEIGDLHDEVSTGDYFHVPRGTTHSIKAVEPVRLVAGYAPGGEEGLLFTCPT
jgi:quercetin dioxygenase-like cupin family protein